MHGILNILSGEGLRHLRPVTCTVGTLVAKTWMIQLLVLWLLSCLFVISGDLEAEIQLSLFGILPTLELFVLMKEELPTDDIGLSRIFDRLIHAEFNGNTPVFMKDLMLLVLLVIASAYHSRGNGVEKRASPTCLFHVWWYSTVKILKQS